MTAAPAYHLVAACYGVKTPSGIVACRQDQRAGYVHRRFQQRLRSQLVRSMKARIRFLLSQSIRHQRTVDRANAGQQLQALFHVHRTPDCEPIDRRVLDGPFFQCPLSHVATRIEGVGIKRILLA